MLVNIELSFLCENSWSVDSVFAKIWKFFVEMFRARRTVIGPRSSTGRSRRPCPCAPRPRARGRPPPRRSRRRLSPRSLAARFFSDCVHHGCLPNVFFFCGCKRRAPSEERLLSYSDDVYTKMFSSACREFASFLICYIKKSCTTSSKCLFLADYLSRSNPHATARVLHCGN